MSLPPCRFREFSNRIVGSIAAKKNSTRERLDAVSKTDTFSGSFDSAPITLDSKGTNEALRPG